MKNNNLQNKFKKIGGKMVNLGNAVMKKALKMELTIELEDVNTKETDVAVLEFDFKNSQYSKLVSTMLADTGEGCKEHNKELVVPFDPSEFGNEHMINFTASYDGSAL